MKQQEAARLNKIVAELAKVHDLLAEQKFAAAVKKVGSLHAKLTDKVDGASKPRAPTKYNLFVKKEYKAVAARYPDEKAPAIMKRLAKMYKGEASVPKAASSGAKKARKPRAKK